MNKKKLTIIIIAAAVVLIGAGTGLFFLLKKAGGRTEGTAADTSDKIAAETHVVTKEDIMAEGSFYYDLHWTFYEWQEEDGTVNGKIVFDGRGDISNDYVNEWRNYTAIPEVVTLIDMSEADITAIDMENAFRGMKALEKVILPDNLERIGKGVFEDCFNLKTIELPDSLLSIGVGAFRNCTSLTGVTLPASLVRIEEGAFENAFTAFGGFLRFECVDLINFGVIGQEIDEVIGDHYELKPYIAEKAFKDAMLTRIEFAKGIKMIPSGLLEDATGNVATSDKEAEKRDGRTDCTIVIPNTCTFLGYNNINFNHMIYQVYPDCSNTTSDIEQNHNRICIMTEIDFNNRDKDLVTIEYMKE